MMKHRIFIALTAGTLALVTQFVYRVLVSDPVGDFFFPFCAADLMRRGYDPYSWPCRVIWEGHTYPSNPLTTVLLALPFSFAGAAGPIILWSTTIGLLVYGILSAGERWRFLLFASVPFVQSFLYLQWAPFMCAIWLLPDLAPLALVKPQLGLAVLFSRPTWRRVLACAAFGLISLAVDPTWPLRFLPEAQTYDGFVPLLTVPLLALAGIRWRSDRARLLLGMALLPKRGIYDQLQLYLLPATARQMSLLIAAGWIGWFCSPIGQIEPPLIITLSTYIPALIMVLSTSQDSR